MSPDDDPGQDLDIDDVDAYNDDDNEFDNFADGNSDLSAELEMEYMEAMDEDQSDGQGNNSPSDQDERGGSMGDSGFV